MRADAPEEREDREEREVRGVREVPEVREDRDEAMPLEAREARAPLVEVGNYPTPVDGAVDRARLSAEGIEAVLFDTEMATNWIYTNALGGVRLMVPREDEAAARRVLATPSAWPAGASGADPDAGELIAPDAPATWCPACHARDVETPDEPPRGLLARWARWFNPGAARRCRACGHTWRA